MAKAQPVHRYDPDYVVGPGPILAEWLEDNGLSPQVAMACVFRDKDQRAQAAARIAQIIDGAPLSEAVAEWLAIVPGSPSVAFWMALEHNYRVGLAAGKHDMGREP